MTSTSMFLINDSTKDMENEIYKRKLECLELHKNGMKTREISIKLKISQRTVQRYLKELISDEIKFPTPKLIKACDSLTSQKDYMQKEPFYRLIEEILSKPPYFYGYLLDTWDYSTFKAWVGLLGRKNSNSYLYKPYCILSKQVIKGLSMSSNSDNKLEEDESIWELQINKRSLKYYRNNESYHSKYYIFTAYCLTRESEWIIRSTDRIEGSENDFMMILREIKRFENFKNDKKRIIISTKSNTIIHHIINKSRKKIYKDGLILLKYNMELQSEELKIKQIKYNKLIITAINYKHKIGVDEYYKFLNNCIENNLDYNYYDAKKALDKVRKSVCDEIKNTYKEYII